MKRKIVSLTFSLLLISCLATAQDFQKIHSVPAEKFDFKKTGTLPDAIVEASGLETFGKGSYWTHNDGGVPVLFNIDSTGNLIRTLHLKNKNRGWEDLAKDPEGNLYIGEFGNNHNNKKDLKILKITNPDSITERVSYARPIRYHYEDQVEFPPPPSSHNFDVDAFIFLNDSLYLFTKNRTRPFNGIINVYALPAEPGEYTAKKVDTFRLEGKMFDNWITGADISEDGNTVALLFHGKVILITDYHHKKFSSGKFHEIELGHYTHKAGICFEGPNKVMIVDEKELGLLGGNIYELKYNKIK